MSGRSHHGPALAVQDEIRVGHVATLDASPVEAGADGEMLRARMVEHGFDRMLVRGENGVVSNYVTRDDLRCGPVGTQSRRIDVLDLTHVTTPVLDVLPAVVERGFLFVAGRSGVTAIITTADLQKVPVRTALFALVTSFEMSLRVAISRQFGDRDPLTALPKPRSNAAQILFDERKRAGQELSRLECMQLCDLGTVAANSELLAVLGEGGPKRRFEKRFRAIQRLRDGVAHSSQLDLVTLPGTLTSLRRMAELAASG